MVCKKKSMGTVILPYDNVVCSYYYAVIIKNDNDYVLNWRSIFIGVSNEEKQIQYFTFRCNILKVL